MKTYHFTTYTPVNGSKPTKLSRTDKPALIRENMNFEQLVAHYTGKLGSKRAAITQCAIEYPRQHADFLRRCDEGKAGKL